MALDAPGVFIHSSPPWGWVGKQSEQPSGPWVHKRRKECKRPRRLHLIRESFQRKVSPKLKWNPFGKHLSYLKVILQVTVIKLLLMKKWVKQTLSTCLQCNTYYWYKCTVPQEGAIGGQKAEPDTKRTRQELQGEMDQELKGTHGPVIPKHLSVGRIVADQQ